MERHKPRTKVAAAGIGGAIATVIVAITGIEDAELTAAIATLASFVLAYVVPE